MKDFEKMLSQYAELAVKIGLNVQKGQTVVISAPINAVEFVRKVSKNAYESGAKHVYVEWSDEETTLIKYKNAPFEAFQEFPEWKAKGYEEWAKEDAAFMTVYSPNPDLLKDVDPERVSTAMKTQSSALHTFTQFKTNFRVSWLVVSVPTKEWAAKIFPDLNESESIQKLWETIFQINRLDSEEPVAAWKQHLQQLDAQALYLNQKKFKKLHYRAKGTDLTVELPEKHRWISAGAKNKNNVYFVPNIPTEEVFSLPSKNGVNGTVSSTKPLNYGGNLIENFTLTFQDGRIIDYSAKTGYETLKRLIETDEGSHYLGEIALVPHDSPISNLNTSFYNTLYDENASCHLAIGFAYPFCLEGGTEMNSEQLQQNEANESLAHVDFMIGSADMEIDGITADGTEIPLFRHGNWALDSKI